MDASQSPRHVICTLWCMIVAARLHVAPLRAEHTALLTLGMTLRCMQGCGKGCDNMSAVVVVLKPFSPFTKAEHEVDLGQLLPPPSLDDISPEFHGES